MLKVGKNVSQYFHSFVVMEQNVVLLVDHGQNLVSTPLLTFKVETLTPFWAIDLYSCLGEMGSLKSYLRGMDFSFYL